MTSLFTNVKRISFSLFLTAIVCSVLFYSCKKDPDTPHNPKQKPSSYSSEVLDKWMTIQLRLLRNATGPNHGFGRHFAYSGVVAFHSLEPELYGRKQWAKKLNGLTGLPAVTVTNDYYYPANVNAGMAAINRLMFPNASQADKAAIDSLENALTQQFLTAKPVALINASADFGKAVANAVFAWSETDNYKDANKPYTPPVGPGLWKPTPPANAAPATPYWGNNRTIITGSNDNTQPAAPIAYSTLPTSAFYQMVKEVYTVSVKLTAEQKAIADFWKDVPGATTPGHWLSVLQQVMKQKPTSLEDAALAYALTGIAINDASITCFKWKYHFNLVRPVTYVREVMVEYSTWLPYLATPAHPEYVSAHSSLSAAAGRVLHTLFGNMPFTDHTYDYLGYAPRSFTNLLALAPEAGISRLYAGIHYTPSIEAGLVQGEKVAANMFK